MTWAVAAIIWTIVLGLELSYRGVDLRVPFVTPAWERIKGFIERVLRIKR